MACANFLFSSLWIEGTRALIFIVVVEKLGFHIHDLHLTEVSVAVQLLPMQLAVWWHQHQ